MSKRDYYEVLGVAKSADDAQLKSAFRKLAMKYHPDRNPGDHSAEVQFKEVNEAYQTLSDAQKRAAYDRFGHAAFANGGPRRAGFRERLLRLHDGHLREFLRRRAPGRRPKRRRRPGARRRHALQPRDLARGGFPRQDGDDQDPDLGHLRGLRRHAAPRPARSRRRARPAAAMGGFARRRASSPSSGPVRTVTGAARSSTILASVAAVPGGSRGSARFRSMSRPASRTARASALPARARRAIAAGRRATFIFSSP